MGGFTSIFRHAPVRAQIDILEDLHREQTHIQIAHFGKHTMQCRLIYQWATQDRAVSFTCER
jgi:hypothetical protein